MTTIPVANIASSTPPSSAGRSASRKAETAGNPFQQMLSGEMADKAQSGNKSDNVNASRPGSTTPSEKSAASAAGAADKSQAESSKAADKSQAESSKAADKEDSTDPNIPALSPELAAMVASLLQRQTNAAGEGTAVESDAQPADPLALLAKSADRQNGDKKASLTDLADSKLAATTQRAAQADIQSEADLDPHALLGKQVDVASKEAQTTEFSSTLQQLSQTAQAGMARTAQPAATPHIGPRVGTPGWDQAIGQRVVWMANGAEQSASLTLNPPELGPLQVVLNVSNSQANATFVAPHAEVRQALEAAMPRLREMLGEVGIQLDQASVSQGAPQQQGEFARSGGQGGSRSGNSADNETLAMEPIVSHRVTAAGNGLVDIFA